MYIRRKVFSVITDEYGEERYFSTTEFINEDAYLEEREYAHIDTTTYEDKKGNVWRENVATGEKTKIYDAKKGPSDAVKAQGGDVMAKGKRTKVDYVAGKKVKGQKGMMGSGVYYDAKGKSTGQIYRDAEGLNSIVNDSRVDGIKGNKVNMKLTKKEQEELAKYVESTRAKGKAAADAAVASRKAAADRLRGEGRAAAEKIGKKNLRTAGLIGAGALAVGSAGAYAAGRHNRK